MLPFWTDAYLADTMHLSNELHGCYLKLLIFAWRQPDCRIKDSDIILKNVLGVTPRKLVSIKPTLMAFWDLKDGFYSQKRLSIEHKKRRDYIDSKKTVAENVRDVDALDVQNMQEMLPKKVNKNNETETLAVAVADADVIYSSLQGARGEIDWMGVRAICLKAAEPVLDASATAFLDVAPIRKLMMDANPCDLQHDILPAIQQVAARGSPTNMRSWRYFIPIALQKRDERLTPLPAPKERPQNDLPNRNYKSAAQQRAEQHSADLDEACRIAIQSA